MGLADGFEGRTFYFKRPGVKQTDAVLTVVRERMAQLGLQKLVVASTRGYTGARAVELLRPDYEVIVVVENTGYRDSRVLVLEEENRRLIEEKGGITVATDHTFGGIGRAVRNRLGTVQAEDILAHTLYIFGQGMKVAIEVVVMAADVGLVSPNEAVVGVGGTSRGCDTAVVVQPACAQNFFDLRVLEVICMPSPRHPRWGVGL